MRIVVVFSLVALAAAKPLIEVQLKPVNYIGQSYPINELQQQFFEAPASGNLKMSRNLEQAFPIPAKNKLWENVRSVEVDLVEPVTSKVLYVEQGNPLTLNSQDEGYIQPVTGKSSLDNSNIRLGRLYPYNEGIEENYPFLPYNYKNIMQYPSRNEYFLRYLNKPETSRPQPRINYDSQDYIHQHDVKHHHIFNNIHDFNQKHVIRKVDYDNGPYIPMYYNKMNKYSRGFLYGNQDYSRSLQQEYVQPWNNNYYNRYWDVDYVRNYFDNLNSEIPTPYKYRSLVEPSHYRNMDLVKPVISRNLDDEDVYPVIKSLDVNYLQPVISKGFKRSLVGQATNVEVNNKTPEIAEHLGGLPLETIPQEGRRQDIQLNANINKQEPVQAEDHISQQPIHRQNRETKKQEQELTPQYRYNPY